MPNGSCVRCGAFDIDDVHESDEASSARPASSALLALADDLAMFASQIREHVADSRNAIPRRAVIDDWLYHYAAAQNDAVQGARTQCASAVEPSVGQDEG